MADTLSTKELAELRQLYKDLQNIQIPDMDKFINALGGVEAARNNLSQMRKEFSNLNSDVSYFAESLSKVLLEMNNQNNALGLTKKAYSGLSSIANKLKYDQDGISRLSEKDLGNMSKKIIQEKQKLQLSLDLNKQGISRINQELQSASYNPKKIAALQAEKKLLQAANIETTEFLKDQEKGYIALVGAINKRTELEKKYQSALGVTGTALKAISKIPGLGGVINTDKATEEMRKYAEELNDQGVNITSVSSRLKIAGKGLSSAFGDLTSKLTDPVTLITFFVTQAFKADKITTDIGKSLGLSKEAAFDLTKSMLEYNAASKDSFMNLERQSKAQAGLSEQLGIAVDFGNEERETFAKLTELTGLSAQEAGKLATFSAATGKSTKNYVSDIRVAALSAQQANKIHISDKELLSTISKLSAGILVKFQGNPKALAEAVVQAKKLGTNLEQMDKTADSLLNWEQSIDNELQAELLTGKKLNLERARAAALTGDQATLMEEVANQVGTLNDFQNMNVLAQRSLAEAFGMTREEMSEMLMKQEAINKYGDKAAELSAKQIEDMEKRNMTAEQYTAMVENQRSVQEEFNDLIIRVQEIFTNIAAGPLGKMMSMFASLLENANAMKVIIDAIAVIYGTKMVIGLGKTIAQLGIALGLSTAKAVADVTSAEALTMGLATVGIIAGLAAVMGAMSSKSKPPQTPQDGIAPASDGPFTITNRFGATAITANGDGLGISPNYPGSGGSIKSSGEESKGSEHISLALNEIKNIAGSIKAMANRPSISYINGEDAFTRSVSPQIANNNAQVYRLA